MGKTIVEKAFARASGLDDVHAGQYVEAKIDRIVADEEFYRMHAAAVGAGMPDGVPSIWDRERFHLVLEHLQPAMRPEQALRQQKMRLVAKAYGLTQFRDVTCGVIHQIAIEDFVLPGELALGSDSHSCAWGALNCVGTGMGEHELVYAATLGELWFRVPETIKIELRGSLSPGVSGKDIVLSLAGKHGSEFGLYRSLEFCGEGASGLSLADRITVAAHAVELGAKFGLFNYDQKVEEILGSREPHCGQLIAGSPIEADGDAHYFQHEAIDLASLEPQVALPHRFDNALPVGGAVGTRVDQAQVGSCANGRVEDLKAIADVVRGRKVSPRTRFFVQPASWNVYRQCIQNGVILELIDAGVQILAPGCHLCLGMQAMLADGDVCISSTTRNHQGRMGSTQAEIYLAAPHTVAAAAIAGCIVDPREYLR